MVDCGSGIRESLGSHYAYTYVHEVVVFYDSDIANNDPFNFLKSTSPTYPSVLSFYETSIHTFATMDLVVKLSGISVPPTTFCSAGWISITRLLSALI